MGVFMSFEGIDELLRQVESCYTDSEIKKQDKKILRECANKTIPVVKRKMPRSINPANSGRKGSRTGQHSADNIPVSSVKTIKGKSSIVVGWEKSDNSPYFYTKFTEWGTTRIKPRAYMQTTATQMKSKYNEIAQEQYQNMVNNKLGGA